MRQDETNPGPPANFWRPSAATISALLFGFLVMRVERSTDQNVLKLPGTMQALTEAPILARADGYLKRRLADIGDRVQAGQVLAEIDAPELDQQMHQAEAAIAQAQAAAEQAEATLEQGKANRELARITADRSKMLV